MIGEMDMEDGGESGWIANVSPRRISPGEVCEGV